MTSQEAIERLKCMRLFMQINDKASESKFLEEDYIANKVAIKALEEIQQYRAIEKSVETLERYVEYAEQKAAEYDEKGETLSMLAWEIEVKAYRNAIKIVKEAGGILR